MPNLPTETTVYEPHTQWMRADGWNYAHRLKLNGIVLCQPHLTVMPLPREATDDDPRCGECSKVVGASTL